MNLEDQLQADLVAAMKAGDAVRRDTLRLAKTALKNEAVARARPLSDDEAVVVLARLTKQLNQAADEFDTVHDRARAAAERAQADLLKPYLPTPLSETELATLVEVAISQTGAMNPADMGRVMAALKPRVGIRADGAHLAVLVRSKLAS